MAKKQEALFEETGTPGIYLIKLPTDAPPGRWEAVREFARRFDALKRELGGKTFSLVPFSFAGIVDDPEAPATIITNEQGVDAYLAVVQN